MPKTNGSTTQNKRYVAISEDLRTVLLNYLGNRPYKEVANMNTLLEHAPLVEFQPREKEETDLKKSGKKPVPEESE